MIRGEKIINRFGFKNISELTCTAGEVTVGHRISKFLGAPGAFVLGLISGLVASQCATPVLAAILTYVMLKGAIVYGAALLFVYALGRGVPVVLAGTFTGALKNLQNLERWSEWIEKASGVVIIAVGLYFLWIA